MSPVSLTTASDDPCRSITSITGEMIVVLDCGFKNLAYFILLMRERILLILVHKSASPFYGEAAWTICLGVIIILFFFLLLAIQILPSLRTGNFPSRRCYLPECTQSGNALRNVRLFLASKVHTRVGNIESLAVFFLSMPWLTSQPCISCQLKAPLWSSQCASQQANGCKGCVRFITWLEQNEN